MSRWTMWFSAACFATLLSAAGLVFADTAHRGDAAHGRAISKGPPEVAAEQACSSCHGDMGEGNPGSGIPRLAGQSQDYLLRALDDYARGERQNEIMTPIARALKGKQREDVTAFYTSLRTEDWQRPGNLESRQLKRGERLASEGSAALGVQGCMNCHGPQGRGLPPTAPYLAGQSADYLVDRLKAWRDGPRDDSADGANIMAHIAHLLKDEDIAAVATYFAQLPPDPVRLGDRIQGNAQEKTP